MTILSVLVSGVKDIIVQAPVESLSIRVLSN